MKSDTPTPTDEVAHYLAKGGAQVLRRASHVMCDSEGGFLWHGTEIGSDSSKSVRRRERDWDKLHEAIR
jgi:hypothetical protein